MEKTSGFLTRTRWGASACVMALSILSPLAGRAAFDATLQGLNAGGSTWFEGNLMGWKELDYIPCRVYMTGGPVTDKSITVEFDHIRGTIPGVENLTGWTTSPNVVFTSPPELSAPLNSISWSYTFRVSVTDSGPAYVEFRARLSAGAHLNVGSSLALRGSPSLGTLQIHKPDAGPGFPDLVIVKRGPANAAPDETITYSIMYTNKVSAQHASVGVQITDILPPQLTYVTNSATGGAVFVGNTLIWDLGDLAIGAQGSVTYRATVKPGTAYGASFHNYAQILSSENDANPGDNVSSVTTLVTFNRPPVANDDSYLVNEDSELSVPAPGVLANDTDADGNPLTVATPRPVDPPVNGSLIFNADGSFTYTPDANFNGTDSFSYHVTDGSVTSAVAIVTITVVPVNDPPLAVADTYNTDEDTALTIAAPGVLANDMDADGDLLIAAVVAGPSHGALSLNTDGSFLYTPALNYYGPDSFTYKVNDGSVDSAPAVVSIAVHPINDIPTVGDDSYSTDEDTALSIPAPGVLENDSDADGDALTALLVAGPAHGTLTLNADGSFSYTPAPNYHGADSFTYRAADGLAQSAIATVSITVRPINDTPVAADDTYATDEDTPLNIPAPGVLANDTDVDGDLLTAILLSGPAHGTVTLSANGSFVYTPVADYHGPDAFTYRANDGLADSGVATVNITVRPINDTPIAANDTYATDEDVALNITMPGVLSNDTDVDKNPLTAALVTSPAHGTLTLNANGSFVYTPTANYNGPDSFAYRANDGTADSGVATVSILVRPVNDAPIAVNDVYATDEDTALSVSVPGVLGNDTDIDADTLTAILVAGPAHGTLSPNANGSFTYTPVANFNGADSFTYQANDGAAGSSIATVAITVRPVNDPPVALDDAYTTSEDTSLNISPPGPLANDSDIDGDPLAAVLVTSPAHGTLVLNSNGSFIYTPAANYNGPDAFSYRANDGVANSGLATVNITVQPVNDGPVANHDSYSTDEDTPLAINAPGVLANDTDADGDPLTASLVAAPGHGSLALNANGSFTYTPALNYTGLDSFTYRASDGSAQSGIATVSIAIGMLNDAPVANNDSYATDEDVALTIGTPGVLANDTDVEGGALSAALVTAPVHGTLTLNANGSFVYAPAPNYHGPDSFTYRASDGAANSAPATVNITVRPVNDPPVAENDGNTTDEDIALVVSAPGVLTNDSDTEGTALTAILVAAPLHGTLELNASGSFIYIPNTNFNGTDSFTYRANDGALDSDVATVTILVLPQKDPRRTSDDSYAILEDATLTVSAPGILGNDLSVDGDALVAFLAQGTLHGTLSLDPNGGFTYVPQPNFNGEDGFIYRAAELESDSGTSRVSIVIRPVNDAPSFTTGPNHFAPQNAGPQTILNWASDISAGPVDEAGQVLTFLVSSDQPALFSTQPAIAADGTLTYVPAPGVHGHANVTVVLKDDGGTLDGGTDTSAPQTFVIGINAPPIASISVPTNGSVFVAPANIAIIAQASDPDGVVTSLEIFAGPGRLFTQEAEPYEFAWTNVPIGNYTLIARATDDLGATGDSAPVSVTVLEGPPILVIEPMHLNLQSGLFEQRVRVLNPTPFDFEGVRVLVTDLPSDVSVYNRSGITNDVAYVQHNLPVPAGGSVDLLIEYYVPNRVPPNPTLRAEVVRSVTARGDVIGELQPITRHLRLADGTFMIEWVSQRNRTYFVQYGDSLSDWKTVTPAVIGTGTRQQWIDNGPPKTDSFPGGQACRFYRVVLVP